MGGRLLILHDLGLEQVNATHSGAGPPIHYDLLKLGEETRQMLLSDRFSHVAGQAFVSPSFSWYTFLC